MADHSIAPMALINEISNGFIKSQALYSVAKLGVADHIGDGRASAGEIANALSADADVLYRVMRTLAGSGVFNEADDRTFSLTPAGQLLLSDHEQSMRGVVVLRCEEIYDAFRQLLHSVCTGEAAFKRVFGSTHFEFLKENEEANRVFQAGMSSVSGVVIRKILRAFDFSRYGSVVDVGGGDGTLLSAILAHNPNVSGTLFDQESTVELARSTASGPLQDCRMVAGDFFEAVPEGGDLYILKSIIHDWADEPSVRILRNCRQAMDENGTLLVLDCIVGPPNQPSAALLLDLTMLVSHGGKERRREEFEVLFDQAGLKLTRIFETGTFVSIMETHAA